MLVLIGEILVSIPTSSESSSRPSVDHEDMRGKPLGPSETRSIGDMIKLKSQYGEIIGPVAEASLDSDLQQGTFSRSKKMH